jgi:hypothetical protein
MTVTRVRFREGQVLLARDLNDEQAYHTAMRRRHNISHHTWGIVRGLLLAEQERRFYVTPGMAVDGYGRELVVPASLELPERVCDRPLFDVFGDRVAVWLVYSRVSEAQCGPAAGGRWCVQALLRLTDVQDAPDPRSPVILPVGWGPEACLPDDPEVEWPVYLGSVKKSGEIDLSHRPYAGLVGEEVRAASGRARVQVGAETAGDERRFAVSLADESGAWTDRLSIGRTGDVTVRGSTAVGQGLVLVAGDEGVPGIGLGPLAAPPEAARPWQIYHAPKTQEPGSTGALRFEIEHPGKEVDASAYRLSVGAWTGSSFVPCLSVAGDCTVKLGADLCVKGQIVRAPIAPDPDDPEFVAALGQAWSRGLDEALGQVISGEVSCLEVEMGEPELQDDHQTMRYGVTIANKGSIDVKDIHAVQYVTIDGSLVQYLPSDLGAGLEPGGQIERQFGYTHAVELPGHDIVAIIAAFGWYRDGSLAAGMAAKTVRFPQGGGGIG